MMKKPLKLYACLKIAKAMNAELSGCAHVTAAQVHAIDAGFDRTESHPIWGKIVAKIKEHRQQATAKRRRARAHK